MSPRILLLWVLFVTPNLIGHTLEFAGFVSSGNSKLILLSDTETNEVSSWLKIGQTWRGFRITSIDDKAWTITVANNGESIVLPLKTDRVVGGKSSPNRGPSGLFRTIRGDCDWTNGKWVYSPDAVVQFGGLLLAATTGVMTSDGKEIRGNLTIAVADGETREVGDATAKLVNGTPIVASRTPPSRLSKKQD